MINEQGGVNGRKINLISLDDGYSPPKTVEQTRQLVEQDKVAFIFSTLGTPTNTAIQQYLNERKVPQLFVATGAQQMGRSRAFPMDDGLAADYHDRGQHLREVHPGTKPDAKIGVLYQNDDFGKDYLQGLKDGLGDKVAKMVVGEASYELTDPTIDSQIVSCKASGADVFIDVDDAKFAAQAIRKAYDIGWKPLHFLNTSAARSRRC